MGEKLNSQETLKINHGVDNGPIFAPYVSKKEAY